MMDCRCDHIGWIIRCRTPSKIHWFFSFYIEVFKSKGREISLPYKNRDGFLEQKFWLSRLLPQTVLLDLDTGTDDVTTSGPSYRCGRQGRTRVYK